MVHLKLGDILIYKHNRGFYLTHVKFDGCLIFEYETERYNAYNIAGFDYDRTSGHERY